MFREIRKELFHLLKMPFHLKELMKKQTIC